MPAALKLCKEEIITLLQVHSKQVIMSDSDAVWTNCVVPEIPDMTHLYSTGNNYLTFLLNF